MNERAYPNESDEFYHDGDDNDDGDGPGDIKKPRKLDDDMVEYMKQLELPLTNETIKLQQGAVAKDEAKSAETQTAYDDEHMDVSVLSRNLIQQLKNKEASAATHRRCSVVVEKLLRLAKPELVAGFLCRIQNYIRFSATNRYASHVLQTSLHVIVEDFKGVSNKVTGAATAEEDEDDAKLEAELRATPEEAVVSLSRAMAPDIVEYMFDQSGTHVVRALISTLVGAEVPTGSMVSSNTTFSKRKRKKKSGSFKRHESHQVKGRDNVTIGPGGTVLPRHSTDTDHTLPQKNHDVPESFTAELAAILRQILSLPPQALLDACFDVNASPCLQHMLRVMYLLDKKEEAKLPVSADGFGSVLLQLESGPEILNGNESNDQEEQDEDEENPIDIVIQMCHSDTASHVVETAIQSSGDNFYQQILDDVLIDHVKSISKDKNAVFVVQQLLLCTRHASQVEKLLTELMPLVPELASTGKDQAILGLVNAMARLPNIPAHSSTLKHLDTEAIEKMQKNVTKRLRSVALESQSSLKSKATTETHKLMMDNPIAWWLDIGHQRTSQLYGSSDDIGSLTAIKSETDVEISAEGCKLVYSMLCLLPAAAKSVLRSITSLPSMIVAALAIHPWGSRYVLEPVFSGPSEFQWAKNKLVEVMSNEWVTLSCDRFGCHVVQKAFSAINDVERKAAIAKQLLHQERKVQGSRFGRFVAKTVKLDHLKQDESSWKSSIKREASKVGLFDDIVNASTKPKENSEEVNKKGDKKKKRRKTETKHA
eukprot:gb/GECG01016011.1/.p1 GENE.gb/GECG01016011.1/~~gb/GECG01016011.1/.p1  ORF type:complete len:766 (+),score=128.33 gb/GECG01016011.1/:1-2298(+)